eukprot:CAMPEP_0203745658 /NCGR_PEP_ID=MMETSP0098-20131031/1328_1 /ASSEMBLY_ACC=CAM_ASM_000208 /TAXON_ID=96639 /ORGANISM=" , Strain NY0313808BC1" /LENGTH=201 /DNA_ID=CAMNT_0050633503 /DNA_START=722 /DNA_END=1327 /DNA_ORIENTATION=+
MSLPPAYIGNAFQGISELLNARLLKYDERLGGVMLSYSGVRLEQPHGCVFNEVPELQFRVRSRALLFSASAGMRLQGTVNQITAGHIMLLVYGAFQVSIDREHIPEKYTYSSSLERYVSSNDDDEIIELGTLVEFAVIRFRDEGGPWFIEGSLLLDGVSSAVSSNIEASTESTPSKKKKKHKTPKKSKSTEKKKKKSKKAK